MSNNVNPVYSKLDSSNTDLLGPSYSYADHINGPSSMGIGSDGTFSQLGRNASGIAYYVKTLISGDPPLGNQYYINTGGTCLASDGQLRSRYNYINNLPSGDVSNLPSAISELGADFNGLIPGAVDDIESLDPLYIFRSLTSDTSPSCDCYKCPVTTGSQYNFVTPSLDPDFNSTCQKVDNSFCVSTESFTNEVSPFPTILAGLGFLYFVFSGK